MQEAHFFDIDTLIKIESKAWVVDKANPNVPIIKISQSDLKLYKSAIYKKQNNKIEFGDDIYWLPEDFYTKLKIAVKKTSANFGNLAISVKEFKSKEIIESKEVEFNLDVIHNLKNKVEDIYLVCSKHFKYSHESVVEKLLQKLKDEGILIKNFYYLTENFYDIDDSLIFKKIRLLLQHLVGYKTDENKFIDSEIPKYKKLNYYDNSLETLKMAEDINHILYLLVSSTPEGLRQVIKENIKDFKPEIIFNRINENSYNKITSKKVFLELSNIIKKFQIFKEN